MYKRQIQELIDFALDCTRLILGALTGVSRAVSYGNIDDMEGTPVSYTHLVQQTTLVS